jgi:Nucleotide modification associated domain 2
MRSRNPHPYVYKCIADHGGAPCIDDGLLTLTICTPDIRRPAREGDLIFAFGSNNESPANRLVYIAEVSRKVPDGKYFEEDEFKSRADCIYERIDGRLQLRSNAKFHHDEKARISDLGSELSYPNAIAIVAKDFRYFGKCGTDEWKADAPKLCELVDKLQRKHRVNFAPLYSLNWLH